jgi:hypothetical protein
MVVRQHDLIATQLRTAAAGQAPQPRPHARRQHRSALDASRRRIYPRSTWVRGDDVEQRSWTLWTFQRSSVRHAGHQPQRRGCAQNERALNKRGINEGSSHSAVRSSPACGRPDGMGRPWAQTPGFAPRRPRADDARRGGTGHGAQTWDYRSTHTSDDLQSGSPLNTCDLTSHFAIPIVWSAESPSMETIVHDSLSTNIGVPSCDRGKSPPCGVGVRGAWRSRARRGSVVVEAAAGWVGGEGRVENVEPRG